MSISQQTSIQAYQLRPSGAAARLAIFRMMAADSANNLNPSTRLHPSDWRGARSYTLGSFAAAYCSGLNQGKGQWHAHMGEQFRNEFDVHSVTGFKYHAWHTNCEGSELAIGIVASLPHARFIAGYRWTSNDERVYFPEIFDDDEDSMRMADEHARVFAELARCHDERFSIMVLSELDEGDKTIELQKAIALRSRAKFGGRDRVREACDDLRKARETLREDTAAYERDYS